MKKIILFSLAATIGFAAVSCQKKSATDETVPSCNKPVTATPAGLTGNWASGYASMTQLVNVYNGSYAGNAWVSGKFFKFTATGNGAEFYYSAQSQYAQTATKATGSVYFDAGSTAAAGSFTFYPCKAHYKGWGSVIVDRDATTAEIENNLTVKYYYKMEGSWLRIQPNGPVNEYSSSFKIIN